MTDAQYRRFVLFMDEVKRLIYRRYVDDKIKACGTFGERLFVTTERDGNWYIGTIYDGTGYIKYVEFGRPPSKKQPPVMMILEWLHCKKIPIPARYKDERAFAWAIAKSIKKRGTTWWRQGGARFIWKATTGVDDLAYKMIDDIAIQEIKTLEDFWQQ